jgi:delta 1-pyrroline-5-carboxylate dehydrogenase
MFDVIDPASGKVVGSVPDMDAYDTAKAIQAATDAFQTWKNTTAKVHHKLSKKGDVFSSQSLWHVETTLPRCTFTALMYHSTMPSVGA